MCSRCFLILLTPLGPDSLEHGPSKKESNMPGTAVNCTIRPSSAVLLALVLLVTYICLQLADPRCKQLWNVHGVFLAIGSIIEVPETTGFCYTALRWLTRI